MGRRWALALVGLVEPQPEPLQMSDTEVLDWLGEYCDQAVYTRPTKQVRGGFVLYCAEGITAKAETLRGAVMLAAAKHKEANE